MVIRASMPKPEERSFSKSIRHRSIHAQNMKTFLCPRRQSCGEPHRCKQAEATPLPAHGPFRPSTGHRKLLVCCAPVAASWAACLVYIGVILGYWKIQWRLQGLGIICLGFSGFCPGSRAPLQGVWCLERFCSLCALPQ